MAAVQHAQLHVFKRQYIADQLGAGQLPRRASGDEVVFHHPLNEGLAGDSAFVAHAAQRGGDLIQRSRRGGRHDAVHHGAGEGGGGGDPIGERRIPRLRQIEHRSAQHVAVLRNIVAGEQGKGGQAAFAPQPQRLYHNAGHGLRLMRRRQIGDDPRMLPIQLPVAGLDAVAFFGDGHRDDCHLRLCQLLQHCGDALQLAVQAFMHRADHNGLMAVRAFLQHAVQMILLPQRLKQRHAARQADFANAPVAALGVQYPIRQQRLMCAVKRAETQVHDTAAQGTAIIVRLPDGAR